MSAQLESMMYVGALPWHGLGIGLDRPATATEAVLAAGLHWDVQKQPLYTGSDRSVRIRDRYVICRTDRLDAEDGGQLGVVGRDYTPLQNRDAFSFLDPVVGEGGAVYHTAGSLRGGRRVWMLAKLPGEIRVVGDDTTEKYLLLSTSHDGTSSVRIGLTPIRVVCQNTLNLAIRGMGGLSIPHFPDVVQRVRQAHEVLGLAHQTLADAGDAMRAMARVQMTGDRLASYWAEVLPLPLEDEPVAEKVRQRHARFDDLFVTGFGHDLPGVKGTLWAAYNAVTQWTDHESYTRRTREPLNSIWFGEGDRLKRQAFDVARRYASTLN